VYGDRKPSAPVPNHHPASTSEAKGALIAAERVKLLRGSAWRDTAFAEVALA